MSKSKLWIFGDSYAEDNTQAKIRMADRWNGVWNWPEEIGRVFDVENMGISGCGPQTQLDRFTNHTKDRELEFCKDVNVLFFISNPYRVNFNFYTTPFHQTYITQFSDNISQANDIEKQWDYKKYNKFVKQYVNYLDIDPIQEVEKYVSYLKMYSKFFNKMMVFTCFHKISDEIAESINTDNFCYMNEPLIQVDRDPKYRYAVNHLSDKNHKVMYSMLTSYFLKGHEPKFSRFV
jgi:hypothetical protein